MITDEEIYKIAEDCSMGIWEDDSKQRFLWFDGDRSDAINSAYQLGRQHQRERDAVPECTTCSMCGRLIAYADCGKHICNTGELKRNDGAN